MEISEKIRYKCCNRRSPKGNPLSSDGIYMAWKIWVKVQVWSWFTFFIFFLLLSVKPWSQTLSLHWRGRKVDVQRSSCRVCWRRWKCLNLRTCHAKSRSPRERIHPWRRRPIPIPTAIGGHPYQHHRECRRVAGSLQSEDHHPCSRVAWQK